MRFPVIGKTVGTITKTPGGGSFYGVEWDADEVGQFPCSEWEPGRTYTKGQLEWLLSEKEMEKYVPTTTNTQSSPNEILEFHRKAAVVAGRAKRAHPGKSDYIDEIMKHVGILEGNNPLAELPRGSIVRHPTMSVAYVRVWSGYSDGGSNWRSTNSNSGERMTWSEVLRLCSSEPVVLLNTQRDANSRDENYEDADRRLGLKRLGEQA